MALVLGFLVLGRLMQMNFFECTTSAAQFFNQSLLYLHVMSNKHSVVVLVQVHSSLLALYWLLQVYPTNSYSYQELFHTCFSTNHISSHLPVIYLSIFDLVKFHQSILPNLFNASGVLSNLQFLL